LKGKIWVTRKNLFVDRLACGWLIRRFIDQQAIFKFVSGSRYTPQARELRFDMFEGEFTHTGDLCTFESLIQQWGLQDPALAALAEVVHDIDLKDRKYERSETEGFRALLTGLVTSCPDDQQRLEESCRLFDSLYHYFQGGQGEPNSGSYQTP
jgi:hypothetical protein